MKKLYLIFFLLVFIFNLFSSELEKKLKSIKLPEGFKIEIYAENIVTARGLTIFPDGTVFVGSKIGNIYALVDKNKDMKLGDIKIIASNLNMPVGVNYYKGDLYVSEIGRILKYEDVNKSTNNLKSVIVNDTFPKEKHHGWKFIKIGPDNKIYVPVGAPCNICLKNDERYASIMRMDLNGKNLEVFASGVRNTVGFDWHPEKKELWFTDNGSDGMGDNIPPDELNNAPKK